MENINTLKANLSAIGDAIRGKLAVENKYRIEDMPAAINSISSRVEPEPCIVNATLLVAGSDSGPHNDWDKIKNLIDYENAYELSSMFANRKDLRIREVEDFLSHGMPNIKNIQRVASNANFIDKNIDTYIFNLTLNSPNCPSYLALFERNHSIRHLNLIITEHNVDFQMNWLFTECSLLQDVEITGPGLSHVTALNGICKECTNLRTVTIGDDGTNYSKVKNTTEIFKGSSNLETLTIKGVNVLPLTSTDSITSTIQSIKVPARLVKTYKNATNWSTFASKISAI